MWWGRLDRVPHFFQASEPKGWMSAWSNPLLSEMRKQGPRKVPGLVQVTGRWGGGLS